MIMNNWQNSWDATQTQRREDGESLLEDLSKPGWMKVGGEAPSSHAPPVPDNKKDDGGERERAFSLFPVGLVVGGCKVKWSWVC